MAMAKQHVLALPREIRDHIYGYLQEKKTLQWGDWKRTEAFNYGLFTIVFASESDPVYSISHVLWQEFLLDVPPAVLTSSKHLKVLSA
jgi:hypothetical protein